MEKYPQAAENIEVIKGKGGVLQCGVDVGRKGGMRGVGRGWERVVFNFPHVGGKSTDVNRQVRYNQGELVLCFHTQRKHKEVWLIQISWLVELLVSFFKSTIPLLDPKSGSSILVTLFDGPPYTLWNIRDLARHSGLEVKRSWKFQREMWKGYRHARTLGVVRGGGGWKGEERDARTYEFVRKGEGAVVGPGKKRGESSDEEEGFEMGEIGPGDLEVDVDEPVSEEEGWEGFEADDTDGHDTSEDDED